MLSILILACTWGDPAPNSVAPTPAADPPPPDIPRGVSEVVTPPGVIRPTEVNEAAGAIQLDVWFDPAHTTFEALGARLDAWGFTRLDGDGESWRVVPPAGWEWAARLEPLPEVWKVEEAIDVEPLPSGALREGQERYGALLHTWSWRDGGPIEVVTGGAPPPKAVLPAALPAWAVTCVAPAMEQLSQGLGRGVGWERAWQERPAAWVLVLEDFGGCKATGWVPLVSDGALDALAIGERPLADATLEDVWTAASDVLRAPRADDDPAAVGAVALLKDAPDDMRVRALDGAAPGPAADALARAWLDAAPDAALAWARAASSSSLNGTVTARALLVTQDANDRAAALADAATPPDVLIAALNAWRPSQNEGADVLARLRAATDPRVRARAFERTMDAEADACRARLPSLTAAASDEASAAWRACPMPEVRDAVFARLRGADAQRASTLVAEVLERPETLAAGIAAVRQAEALGRMDLLLAAIPRQTVSRGVRREALARVVATNQPGAAVLVASHGRYLGYVEPPAPATAEGSR